MFPSLRLLAVVALFSAVALTSPQAAVKADEEGSEPEVDCAALMTEFPTCADMTYILCTDGTAPTCANEVPPNQGTEGGGNATNSNVTLIDPCEKFVCYENGTYASMEDDTTEVVDLEDDGAGASNGTQGGSGTGTGTGNGAETASGTGTSGGGSLRPVFGSAVTSGSVLLAWAAAGLSTLL